MTAAPASGATLRGSFGGLGRSAALLAPIVLMLAACGPGTYGESGSTPRRAALPGPALGVTVVRTLQDAEPPFPETRGPLWSQAPEGLVGALGDVLPQRRWEGRVVDVVGPPIAGAVVRILPNGASQLALGVEPEPYREFIGLGYLSVGEELSPVDGERLAGVPHERWPATTTDADGRFALVTPELPMSREHGLFKPGRWEPVVHVVAAGRSWARALTADEVDDASMRLAIDPGLPALRAEPLLAGPVTLRGRVVDGRGEPVPDARVWASHLSGFLTGNGCVMSFADLDGRILLMAQLSRSGWWGRTDERGRFAVAGLPEDGPDYSVVAFAPGLDHGAATGLDPDEESVVGLVPAARLEVDVVDADSGAPLAVRALRAFALTRMASESAPLVCLPRRDNDDPFVAARRCDEPATSWVVHRPGQLATRLVLDVPDRVVEPVTVEGVEPASVARVTIAVPASRDLAVDVRAVGGAAVPGALVIVRRLAPGHDAHLEELARRATDADGRARFERLWFPDLLLEVRAAGHGPICQRVADGEAQSVALQPVGRLLVSLEGEAATSRVTATRAGPHDGLPDERVSAPLDPRNRARFELSPGPWSVEIGAGVFDIEIAPGGQHELTVDTDGAVLLEDEPLEPARHGHER